MHGPSVTKGLVGREGSILYERMDDGITLKSKFFQQEFPGDQITVNELFSDMKDGNPLRLSIGVLFLHFLKLLFVSVLIRGKVTQFCISQFKITKFSV